MKQYLPLLVKFIKFAIIGFSSMLIDFSITFLFKEKLKLNKYVANTFGFTVAASFNFYMNRNWTFQSNSTHIYEQAFRFFCIASAGLLLNNAMVYFFTEKKDYNFYFSKGLATLLVVFWNFTMNYFFTFHK